MDKNAFTQMMKLSL
jgi:hypothetical protein